MPIIYRYIIRKFATTFIFTILLFILIAIVFDVSEKIDDFIENEAPLRAIIVDYYFNFIPYFMNLFSPLFIFISAVYFTSRMASNTEFIAILSTGMNYYRLLIPYLFVGVILAIFSYYLNGWVIPRSNQNMVKFEAKYLKSPYQNTDMNIHRQLQKNQYMYMESFDYQDSMGFRFTLEQFDGNSLKSKLSATSIKWDNQRHKWIARDYSKRILNGMQENYITGDTLILNLPITPEDFGRKDMAIQAMTNDQLNKFIETEKLRGDEQVSFYTVERYKRGSMPFATLVLIVIALALSSRKIRGGMGMHLGLGLLIAFSYILVLQFSTTFAIKSDFPPIFSVWLPNIIYGILGIILLAKTPK